MERRGRGWGEGEQKGGGIRVHASPSTQPGLPGLGSRASPVVARGYFSGKPGGAQAQGPPLPASLPSDHPGSNPRSRPIRTISHSLSWGDEDMRPHPGQRASSGLPSPEPWRDPRRIQAETLVSGLSPAGSLPRSVRLGFVHQPPGGGMGWGRVERGTGAVKGDFEWRAPHLGPSTSALLGPLLGEGRREPPGLAHRRTQANPVRTPGLRRRSRFPHSPSPDFCSSGL